MLRGDLEDSLFQLVNDALDWTTPIPARALTSNLPEIIEVCMALMWLKPAGHVEEITCIACSEPHKEKVRGDRTNGYWHKCLENKRVEITEDEIRQFRFDRDAFCTSLVRAIGGDPRLTSSLANGHLIKLGSTSSADSKGKFLILGLAFKLEGPNAFASVASAMANDYPKGPGLVLVIGPSPINGRTLSGHHFADAAAFFQCKEGDHDIVFESESALQYVFGSESSSKRTGRKKVFDARINQVVSYIFEQGKWPSKKKDQYDAILDNWKAVNGGTKAPSRESLPRMLARVLSEMNLK